MALIGLSLHNAATVKAVWRKDNPRILVLDVKCDLTSDSGHPIPYSRDQVHLHGSPDEIRAFAESIIAALPPQCPRCGTSVFDGAKLCGECEADERHEDLERNRGPQTLGDVGMCEADFR